MNVVIVSEGLAYPPTAGNRIRTLNLMRRLAARHQITYICRGGEDPRVVREAKQYLADHNIQPIIADHGSGPEKSGSLFYAKLTANVFSSLPYAVASHNSRAVHAAIRRHALSRRVDLWQFEWLPYVGALPAVRAPRVIMAHNVETLIWQRYAQIEPNAFKRWYLNLQRWKFERFERRIFRQATRVVTVSPEDAALVQERFGVQSVSVVENGIEKSYFDAATGTRQTNTILFLGSLDWRPNRDAVSLLLDHIFPVVRRRESGARLCIVGRNPPESLIHRVKEMPGVELHANVADVRPFLATSGVMAVPLRIGGGSRLKILEALACGLPVVSTAVGCEGLSLIPGRHLIVADRIEQMADALVQCIREPSHARVLAEQGRQLVQDRYDWDALADRLECIWQACLRSGPALQEAK